MSKFRPTPRQKRAITAIDRSMCVRAGAGTGKTSVLVGRYMELLRRHRVPVPEIAALTYTEKAAKVMQDRIRSRCLEEELAAADADDASWWRKQRIDLEAASISTIHGFCSRLLSEHPVEAGVDPYFTVLDEVEQSILVSRCVEDVIKRWLEEEDAGVLELCRELSVRTVIDMLSRMVLNRAEAAEAVKRLESKTDDETIDQWRRLLVQAQAAHVDDVLAQASEGGLLKAVRDAECSDPSDKMALVREEVLHLVGSIAAADGDKAKIELAEKLRRTVSSLRGGSKAKWADDDLALIRGGLSRLRHMLDEVPGGAFDRTVSEIDHRALAFTRCLITLYGEAAEAYGQEKAEGGHLDFEDLLIGARDLLEHHTGVRAKLQRRMRYLLVDELQDSALIERGIILPMVRDEEVFRKSGVERIVPGKLFVVGDDKQSIYRFRGAEVTMFRDFTDRMEAEGEVVELDVSFRTVPRGVAFANDFFGRLLGREKKRRPYENRYLDLKANRREDEEFLEVMIPQCVSGETAAEARSREARMIAGRIEEMVGGEENLVYDAERRGWRPVRHGDIAVLFRAMTAANIYEHAFREAGVPYYIIAGRGFYRAQEIMDMLTMLRAIERPRDRVALVGALRSPLFGISDETLFFMTRLGSVREGLERAEEVPHLTDDQRRGLIAAREILAELAAMKNRMPISRFLEEILRRTGYDAVLLAQFMGRQKYANVEKLIDVARSFEDKGLFTLDDFLRYIEEFVSVEARESERAAEEEASNVVKMMSVHRAKGLEFPVVFVADMSHRPRGAHGRLLFDRDLGVAIDVKDDAGDRPVLYELIRGEDSRREAAEDLRLLYVAVTRARDHLVLSGWLVERGPRGSWLEALGKVYGLFDGGQVAAESLVFGNDGCHARVRTEVPELRETEAQLQRRAGWKVVKRLARLADRIDEADRAARFERTEYVEPLTLDLSFKRRFIASEFTEYRYCPHRYRLARILGLLPADAGLRTPGGQGNGLRMGTVVHRVLAGWDFTAGSLDRVLEEVLTGEDLAGKEGEVLGDEAKRMIERARAAGTFDEMASAAERRSEYPLAARVGDFVIEGIIDSVHRLEDGTWEIVDYKTDVVGEAGGIEELAGHYELQLASYAVAFAKSGLDLSRVSLVFVRVGQTHVWPCDAGQVAAWEDLLRWVVADIRSGRFDGRREGPCRCGYGWSCGGERAEAGDLDLM